MSVERFVQGHADRRREIGIFHNLAAQGRVHFIQQGVDGIDRLAMRFHQIRQRFTQFAMLKQQPQQYRPMLGVGERSQLSHKPPCVVHVDQCLEAGPRIAGNRQIKEPVELYKPVAVARLIFQLRENVAHAMLKVLGKYYLRRRRGSMQLGCSRHARQRHPDSQSAHQ